MVRRSVREVWGRGVVRSEGEVCKEECGKEQGTGQE